VTEPLQCFDFGEVEGREPDGVVEKDGDGEGVAGGPFGPRYISLVTAAGDLGFGEPVGGVTLCGYDGRSFVRMATVQYCCSSKDFDAESFAVVSFALLCMAIAARSGSCIDLGDAHGIFTCTLGRVHCRIGPVACLLETGGECVRIEVGDSDTDCCSHPGVRGEARP
jgi:hypothetical protein